MHTLYWMLMLYGKTMKLLVTVLANSIISIICRRRIIFSLSFNGSIFWKHWIINLFLWVICCLIICYFTRNWGLHPEHALNGLNCTTDPDMNKRGQEFKVQINILTQNSLSNPSSSMKINFSRWNPRWICYFVALKKCEDRKSEAFIWCISTVNR